jgi:hypothetical protein
LETGEVNAADDSEGGRQRGRQQCRPHPVWRIFF